MPKTKKKKNNEHNLYGFLIYLLLLAVEKYNSKGKHKGAYDPKTGEKIKEPKPDRTVEP